MASNSASREPGTADEPHRRPEGVGSREPYEVEVADRRLKVRRQAGRSAYELDLGPQLGSDEVEPLERHAITGARDQAIDEEVSLAPPCSERNPEPIALLCNVGDSVSDQHWHSLLDPIV